jgi:hypothetical protein
LDSSELDSWLDDYARDKRIEDDMDKSDAIDLVNILKRKGFKKLNANKIKAY